MRRGLTTRYSAGAGATIASDKPIIFTEVTSVEVDSISSLLDRWGHPFLAHVPPQVAESVGDSGRRVSIPRRHGVTVVLAQLGVADLAGRGDLFAPLVEGGNGTLGAARSPWQRCDPPASPPPTLGGHGIPLAKKPTAKARRSRSSVPSHNRFAAVRSPPRHRSRCRQPAENNDLRLEVRLNDRRRRLVIASDTDIPTSRGAHAPHTGCPSNGGNPTTQPASGT
jgi:hypothetical protein